MAGPPMTPLFGVPTTPQAAPAAPAPVSPMSSTAPPQTYHEQDGKHRGVAGVARDILGTLGDFLLTRLHMPAMYGPAQHERRLSAAEQNIDTDPVGAIQQVTSIDPVFGAKLRDQYIDNTRQQASLAATKEMRDGRLAQAQSLVNDRTRGRVAAMLGTMGDWDEDKRKQNYGAMRDQALKYAQANNLDLGNELPETYDPVSLDSFIDGAVPVGVQRGQRLTKERIDNQDKQANDRLGERTRHNIVTEGQGDARISQGEERIGIASARAAASANRPKKVSNIQSYVGDDDYKYTQRSDGTTVKSPTHVRPVGGKPKPTEGMRKIIGGVTYVWKNGQAVKE